MILDDPFATLLPQLLLYAIFVLQETQIIDCLKVHTALDSAQDFYPVFRIGYDNETPWTPHGNYRVVSCDNVHMTIYKKLYLTSVSINK